MKLALMIENVPQPPTRQGPASFSGLICSLSARSNKADHGGLLLLPFQRVRLLRSQVRGWHNRQRSSRDASHRDVVNRAHRSLRTAIHSCCFHQISILQCNPERCFEQFSLGERKGLRSMEAAEKHPCGGDSHCHPGSLGPQQPGISNDGCVGPCRKLLPNIALQKPMINPYRYQQWYRDLFKIFARFFLKPMGSFDRGGGVEEVD